MEEKNSVEEAVVIDTNTQVITSEEKLKVVLEEIKNKYTEINISDEQQIITVPVAGIIEFMQDLKNNYSFDFLSNLTAVDYPDKNKFDVIYNLNSIEQGYSIYVKTEVSRENPELPSVFPIWGGANWQEREVYDLLGIVFTGHPNLKRILLDDAFEGYPLRRDFEWEGGRQ
ncbi:NADH-quinone oxidoreductase subunit C [Desulfolucanica intricata]|uniref:NADH-quinone oxidoreductase subunit C n=1 Tax=Desulfolucanica intricata TaxID=1285191 RepID=UPI0009ECDDC2|nr:NADH-quinone oxidoreductase subunit C [Desulfolucanica intricata]